MGLFTGCVEGKTYAEDKDRLAQSVSACRTQDYWFLYSVGGPYEISDCVTESYRQAIQFGHSNITVGGSCDKPQQSEWVAPTQTFTNSQTGQTQYYPRPTDSGDYGYMTYRPC